MAGQFAGGMVGRTWGLLRPLQMMGLIDNDEVPGTR